MERHNGSAARVDLRGHMHRPAFKGDGAAVDRQAVESRAAQRGKRLELIERRFLVEHRQIAFERIGRVEDARAAAGRFFGRYAVRSAVGAEKELGIA